jgi:hypothetical protein
MLLHLLDHIFRGRTDRRDAEKAVQLAGGEPMLLFLLR